MANELDITRKTKPFWQSKRFWGNFLLTGLGIVSELAGNGTINGSTGLIVGAVSNVLLNSVSDGAKLTVRKTF
jgi:hypothetical protein